MTEKPSKKHGARYPPELRAKAVADLKAGMGPTAVAEKHNVNAAIVSYWRSVDIGKSRRSVSNTSKGTARGGSRGGSSRLRFAMAKRVKDHVKQHVRDGGDLGEFETDVLALCNDIMRGDEEE